MTNWNAWQWALAPIAVPLQLLLAALYTLGKGAEWLNDRLFSFWWRL